MRKYLFILLALLFVVGCSDDSNDEVAIEKEPVEDIETEEDETESKQADVDREPLPFDSNEFTERYYENVGDHEEMQNSMALSVEEDSITLGFGTMIEAQIVLNTLNDFMQDDAINELTEDMTKALVDSGNYESELVTSGIDIWISAIDVSSVMVTVSKE